MSIYGRRLFYEHADLPQGGRLLLFGAGMYGRQLRDELERQRPDLELAGFIDGRVTGTVDGLSVWRLEDAPEADGVILATTSWHSMARDMVLAGRDDFLVLRPQHDRVRTVFHSRQAGLLYLATNRTGSKSLIQTMGEFADCREEVVDAKPENDPFSFVRNPFDRVVSCWTGHFTDRISAYAVCAHVLLGKEGLLFEEYVQMLSQEPGWAKDVHVRPYSTFIPQWVDHVGQLEDMARHLQLIGEKAGVSLGEKGPFSSKRNPDYRAYYTPELRRQVEEMYTEDLECFGYEF